MRVRAGNLIVLAAALLLGPAPAHAAHCGEIEALAAEIAALRDSDPEAGIARGRAVLADLDQRGHECVVADALVTGAIGSNLMVLGRNAAAAAELERALERMPATSDPRHLSTLHRGAGLAYSNMESFETAITHYLRALAASESVGDTLESAKTAGNIGILYNTLGHLDESRDYMERALAGFREVEWQEGIAGSLINLGSLAAKLARNAAEAGDEAAALEHNERLLEYNRQALEIFADLGNRRGVAYAASNVGLGHDQLGRPESALPFHQRALEARREIGDRDGTINSLVSMGASLTKLGRFDEAARALEEALELVPGDQPTHRLSVIDPWVALEEARGDYDAAFGRLRDAEALRREIAVADQQSRIAEIQARFDSEHQAREIADLRHAQELTEIELKRERLYTFSAVAIAILLFALAAALLARYRLKVRSQAALEQAARTDELTGLANRRDIRERIAYEIQRTRRTSRPFSLGIIDLDGFKQVNDDFGHAFGDQVLVAVSNRILATLRRQDSLARWGGDELLLLLPETDEAGALALGEKLAKSFDRDALTVDRKEVRTTITVGVTQYWPGMSIDDGLQYADAALYDGKRSGRNRAAARRP